MNQAVVNSYYRSILRGRRTLEQVPPEMREAVAALLGQEQGQED